MRVMSAKSGPVISAVRVLGRRAYIWKVLVGCGVWVCKIFGEKKTSLLGGNIFYLSKNETPHPFVKLFSLRSGTSVKSMVGLILVRKIFNCFNFYSIYK